MVIKVATCRSNAYSTTMMLNGQKIVVVMPAYNAARTLRQTYDEVMAHGIVDLVIVVDDASQDETVAVARTLDRIQVEVHPVNRGYRSEEHTSELQSRLHLVCRLLLEKKKKKKTK